jgi:hypothetical protein
MRYFIRIVPHMLEQQLESEEFKP